METEKRDLCGLVEVTVEEYGKKIVCRCKVPKCIYTNRHDLFCPVWGNGTVWEKK